MAYPPSGASDELHTVLRVIASIYKEALAKYCKTIYISQYPQDLGVQPKQPFTVTLFLYRNLPTPNLP